ncbi:MAG: SDR family oxidoreductase [Rubrivivax sp.]
MQIDLSGRGALITGGSQGLGLATALNFAQSGADVAILARNRDKLEAAREQIAAHAPKARVLPLQCDVRDKAQIENAFAAAESALGKVDILVNNAGGFAAGTFVSITDEAWTSDLEVKLLAMVRMTRLAWPGMVQRRWGRVINVLNTLAKAPPAGTAPTSVTRAAQIALTKVLAQEGAPHNVLVNALLVGSIKSEGIVHLHRNTGSTLPLNEFIDAFVQTMKIPLGRMGEADEFGKAACFLASDASSYITGTAINIDGGSCPVP